MSESKMRKEWLSYTVPLTEGEETDEFIETLKSSLLAKGSKTIDFEKKFAEYVEAKHAVGTNSATAALHTALLAVGIGKGDEVITTPMTSASTVNAIIHTGAKPVFVDIEPVTYCINPYKIEEKITEKTKAIVPVHYAGQSCDMDPIMNVAKKYSLFVLNLAYGPYIEYKGENIGNIGDITSFGFCTNKNIYTGEGGMITTNSDEIAKKANIISCHGENNVALHNDESWKYDIEYPGFEYNMLEAQATVGIHQLNKIEMVQLKKEQIANYYNIALYRIPEINIPFTLFYSRPSWDLYVIQIKDELLKIDRDQFVEELSKENIGTSVHFVPLHLQPYYAKTLGYKKGDFEVAEKVYSRIISIPLYPSMTIDDAKDVVYAIKRIADKYKK